MQSNLIIFLFSFFLFTFSAVAQKLPKGLFTFKNEFGFKEITIKKGNRFEYKSQMYCIQFIYGVGKYSFDGKFLKLKFDNNQDSTSFSWFATDSIFSNLYLYCDDLKNSTSLILPTVRVKNTKWGAKIKENGKGRIKIANSYFPIELEVSYLGCENQLICLETPGNYSITISLCKSFGTHKSPELIFEVEDYDSTVLKMKSSEDKSKYEAFINYNNLRFSWLFYW